jgi:hypothetical protein
MNDQPTFFDFAAEVGLTKHIGGLSEVTVKIYPVDTQVEAQGILQRYGLAGMLRVMGRMLLLYARSPAYREFVKGVRQGGLMPANLAEYFGYGLFVGRK